MFWHEIMQAEQPMKDAASHPVLPRSWQEIPEVAQAVQHFYSQPELSQGDLALLVTYCTYYITAPCWDGDTASPEVLAALRFRITQIGTSQALDAWLDDCLAFGLDPLK